MKFSIEYQIFNSTFIRHFSFMNAKIIKMLVGSEEFPVFTASLSWSVFSCFHKPEFDFHSITPELHQFHFPSNEAKNCTGNSEIKIILAAHNLYDTHPEMKAILFYIGVGGRDVYQFLRGRYSIYILCPARECRNQIYLYWVYEYKKKRLFGKLNFTGRIVSRK